MLRKFCSLLAVGLALLAPALPAARPALAAPASFDYTVNSVLDEIDDNLANTTCHTVSNTCTLRAAIMQADNVPPGTFGVAIIVPSGTYSLTRQPVGADGPDSGDLNLTSGSALVQLFGAGAERTIIDGNQHDRVLKVNSGRSAMIYNVTVRGGRVTGYQFGGGVYNAGNLTLAQTALSGNQADNSGGGLANATSGNLDLDFTTFSGNRSVNGNGGGLYNANAVTLTHSTLSNNSASLGGGGLYNESSTTALVDHSTLSGNHADYGGGLRNGYLDSLLLINSTLSGNEAVGDGGGLYNAGTANIYNTTIVFNLSDADHTGAGSAGGVFNRDDTGSTNLRNSLLAGDAVGDYRVYDDCTGTLNSYGWNLFGELGELSLCTINLVSGGWNPVNALANLGPLQNNGGPTLTHALLTDSNAIDAGDPVQGCVGPDSQLLFTDQRDLKRAVGSSCDIGAFEYLPPMAYLPFMRR